MVVGFSSSDAPLRILFEELFYNTNNKRLRVFCIDGAIHGEAIQTPGADDELQAPSIPLVPTLEAYAID
jgi:hypothetical protein